jgi:hypothetical protein
VEKEAVMQVELFLLPWMASDVLKLQLQDFRNLFFSNFILKQELLIVFSRRRTLIHLARL